MGFGQKLNQWLHSGGTITKIWKWWLVIAIVMYPVGFITPYAGTVTWGAGMLAVLASFFQLVGYSVQGRARINAEEYLKVKEEHEAKKREDL